jgi:hypothetical protein
MHIASFFQEHPTPVKRQFAALFISGSLRTDGTFFGMGSNHFAQYWDLLCESARGGKKEAIPVCEN